MAASSQHRCVFVGNIPYDATEDQLKEICQEVGPVVHFRLVTDKETGRPKGYGFCEYIDEETALSARRNLQGYEINGRQLRVDFAENDKSSDRSKDQGRGGPGLAPNPDMQKQQGGPTVPGDSSQQQPIGHQIALTAATVMAAALGGPPNVNGVQNHSPLANDPLTLHLAKLSRSQLTDILSELKALAMRDKESAQQLLLARPDLSKAVFQAEIMLGLVTPQVLQMPNIRQNPAQPPKPLLTDGSSFLGLPPISRAALNPISGPIKASVVQPQVPIPQQHSTFHPSSSSNKQVRVPSSSTPNNKQIPSLQDPRKAAATAVLPPVAASTLPSTSEPAFQAPSRIGPSINPPSDQYRASKFMRLEDGSKAPQVGPGPALVKPSPVTEGQSFEKQHTLQSQLPADVESVLLQQVMTLTPEQISSLPLEQQQQVLQLQQMLRRDQH